MTTFKWLDYHSWITWRCHHRKERESERIEEDTTVAWCTQAIKEKAPCRVRSNSRVWPFICKGPRTWVEAFTTRTDLSSEVLSHRVWSWRSYPLHILESKKGINDPNLPSQCIFTDHASLSSPGRWHLLPGGLHQLGQLPIHRSSRSRPLVLP